MKNTSFAIIMLMLLSPNLFAHCMKSKVYAGGGVTFNSLSDSTFDDAAGFQFFGGYCAKFNFGNPKIGTSIEGGYMDSGDFERSTTRFLNNPNRAPQTVTESRSFGGAWLTGLGEYRFTQKLHVMGRAGLDMGDDSGVILGFGAAVNLTRFMQLRGEYVARDNIDSVQVNLITEF